MRTNPVSKPAIARAAGLPIRKHERPKRRPNHALRSWSRYSLPWFSSSLPMKSAQNAASPPGLNGKARGGGVDPSHHPLNFGGSRSALPLPCSGGALEAALHLLVCPVLRVPEPQRVYGVGGATRSGKRL